MRAFRIEFVNYQGYSEDVCILAEDVATSHDIFLKRYPELFPEHTWDITEDYPIESSKLVSALREADYSPYEISFIHNLIRDNYDGFYDDFDLTDEDDY